MNGHHLRRISAKVHFVKVHKMCRVPLCKQDARAGGNQIQTMNIFGDYNPSHPDWASLMLRGLCSESKPLESDLRSIVARRIAGAFRAQLGESPSKTLDI